MHSTEVLEKEIRGEPVSVTLDGKDYPIGFTIFAVALYKQETAKLNCRRQKEAENAGRPRLTVDEERALRQRYRKVTLEIEDAREEYDRFVLLMQEAVSLRNRLDEEAGCGDSLFQIVNWWKIREDDPDRLLLALWCALHQEGEKEIWESPFSISVLRKIIDFSNVSSVLRAITAALGSHMPRAQETEKKSEHSGKPPIDGKILAGTK